MYTYKRRKKVGAGSIFFIVLFIIIFTGLGFFFFIDKGRFWDIFPLLCIPSSIISFILIIFYGVKRNASVFIFTVFFLIFLSGVVLSNFYGTFALNHSAQESYRNKKYDTAIPGFKIIIEKYPGSRYADDALKNLAYSYYLSSSYKNSLEYFKKAIDEKIVDGQSLEIEKIFADCYVKIAENDFNQRNYKSAGENYLSSITYQGKIKEQFPDTNEAYISVYKIPEYLFKAAVCFNYAKDWPESEQVLNRIINDYSENELSRKSKNLLYINYLSRSSELKDTKNYKECINEFLKILDLNEKLQNAYEYPVYYQKKTIFSGIPLYLMKDCADQLLAENQFKKALFLYGIILENFPDQEENLISNVANCKVKIIKDLNFTLISQPNPSGKFSNKENCGISIVNNTSGKLMIYISGPSSTIVNLETGAKTEIEIKPGTYEIAAEITDSQNIPFYGKITFLAGNRYKEEYKEKA